MKKIEQDIDHLLHKLDKLNFLIAILDEKIEKIKEIEDRVDKLETFNSYIKGVTVGAAAIVSVVVGFGLDIIKRLF